MAQSEDCEKCLLLFDVAPSRLKGDAETTASAVSALSKTILWCRRCLFWMVASRLRHVYAFWSSRQPFEAYGAPQRLQGPELFI